VKGRTVILVDDGLATGTSMRVTIAVMHQQAAARIVVAVPVGAAETRRELQAEADEVICAVMPSDFYAVGMWYENFEQTSDEEVRDLLQRSEATYEASRYSGSRREGD
jgi:putative phosphoribosyl transferase